MVHLELQKKPFYFEQTVLQETITKFKETGELIVLPERGSKLISNETVEEFAVAMVDVARTFTIPDILRHVLEWCHVSLLSLDLRCIQSCKKKAGLFPIDPILFPGLFPTWFIPKTFRLSPGLNVSFSSLCNSSYNRFCDPDLRGISYNQWNITVKLVTVSEVLQRSYLQLVEYDSGVNHSSRSTIVELVTISGVNCRFGTICSKIRNFKTIINTLILFDVFS